MPRERKLTDADLQAVQRMFAAGDTDEQMATVLCCGIGTVKRFRIEHGLKKPRGNPNWCRRQRRKQPEKPPAPTSASTYIENGRLIIKLPPGMARGIVPEPTARVKIKRGRASQ